MTYPLIITQEKVSHLGRAMELDKTSDELSDGSESLMLPTAQVFRTPEPSASQNLEVSISNLESSPANSPATRLLVISPIKKPANALAQTPKMRPSKRFPPPTPSQSKIIQKSVFGYDGDDLSEISDDTDSLKALSQRHQKREVVAKMSARKSLVTESRNVVVVKGRVINSDDEEAFADRKKASSSSAQRRTVAIDEESAEETVSRLSLSAMAKKQGTIKCLESKPSPKSRISSSGRIESVSPVSSPVEDAEKDSELEKPKKTRRRNGKE